MYLFLLARQVNAAQNNINNAALMNLFNEVLAELAARVKTSHCRTTRGQVGG